MPAFTLDSVMWIVAGGGLVWLWLTGKLPVKPPAPKPPDPVPGPGPSPGPQPQPNPAPGPLPFPLPFPLDRDAILALLLEKLMQWLKDVVSEAQTEAIIKHLEARRGVASPAKEEEPGERDQR